MWKRKQNKTRREAFDWPVRWREATPPPEQGSEADIAAAFASASEAVTPSTEIDRQRAWARLRAAVQPASPVRAWAPAFAMGALAVAVLAGLLLSSPGDESGLRQVVLRPATSADPHAANAVLGGQVAVGTPIQTASDTIATVDVDSVGVILLGSDTKVQARPVKDRVARVQLERGEVVARLQQHSPLGLTVQTGDVEVRVTGTVFGVRARPEGSLVRVWRGSVVVRDGGRAVRVREGERYERGEVKALSTADRLEPRVASLIGWTDGTEGSATATPVETPSTAASTTSVEAPAAVSVPVVPRAAVEPEPPRLALADPREPSPRASGRPQGTHRPQAAAAVQPDETNPGREQRLLRLSQGTAPEAGTALYALAALRYDVMGDRTGAVQAWSEYVSRFPEGPLAGDALRQLFEALVAAGDVPGAVALGQKAVQQLASPERERVALHVAEALHRRLSRPAEAVPFYRQVVAEAASDDDADQAAFRLIDALQRAGRTADAHAALDAYLQRFPRGAHVREVQAERQRWTAETPAAR